MFGWFKKEKGLGFSDNRTVDWFYVEDLQSETPYTGNQYIPEEVMAEAKLNLNTYWRERLGGRGLKRKEAPLHEG